MKLFQLVMALMLFGPFTRSSTLLVDNSNGIETVAVYANSFRLGTVDAGQKECLRLPDLQEITLAVRAVGAGSARHIVPEENFRSHEGWILRLSSNLALSANNIMPHFPCTRG